MPNIYRKKTGSNSVFPNQKCKIVVNLREPYLVVAVGSSGILKGKQKLCVTFNSDKLGGIDFTKFSKLTMCSA